MKEDFYEITFGQKKTFLDRDILVDISLSPRANTVVAVEKNGRNQFALMASFIPTNEDCRKVLNANQEISDVNNEFIFIVDCSGSMQAENKIGLVREAMILFLKSLPVNCQFNIIRFGSRYTTLFTQVTDKYNEENARRAEQLISRMSADLGGTELLQPLQWLQNQPSAVNHSRQIFLLTDGEISNVTEVMDLCRSMSTSSRIFSFGLGHAPSRSLIKGLARSTNGRFTFIPPGVCVDIYIAEQLEKALEPCITNVKVKWNIPSITSSKLQSVPSAAPPVYANDCLLFYALIDGEQLDQATIVELWNEEETIRLGLARIDRVSEIINNNTQLITHLAAKALIQEITHEKDSDAESQQTRFQRVTGTDKEKRLINISLKYNIVSPHTTFIGIERRTDSSRKNANSNMALREIPIEILADDKVMRGSVFGSSSHPFLQNYVSPRSNSLSFGYSAALPPPPRPPSFTSSAPPPPPPPGCSVVPPLSYYSVRSLARAAPTPSSHYAASSPVCSSSCTSSFVPTDTEGTNRLLSSAKTEGKPWSSNDQDIVRHLISLQKFDGLWHFSETDMQNLCQKPLASFHSKMSHDPIVLTTAIVIIILERKFNSFKTMWSFIVNKARKRLTEILGENNKLEQLTNEIKNQL